MNLPDTSAGPAFSDDSLGQFFRTVFPDSFAGWRAALSAAARDRCCPDRIPMPSDADRSLRLRLHSAGPVPTDSGRSGFTRFRPNFHRFRQMPARCRPDSGPMPPGPARSPRPASSGLRGADRLGRQDAAGRPSSSEREKRQAVGSGKEVEEAPQRRRGLFLNRAGFRGKPGQP